MTPVNATASTIHVPATVPFIVFLVIMIPSVVVAAFIFARTSDKNTDAAIRRHVNDDIRRDAELRAHQARNRRVRARRRNRS